MKKSLLLLPLVAVSLAGCNPTDTSDYGQLVSIAVLDGLEEEYVQDTSVDLSEVSVTATYEGTTLTIEGDDLTFNPTTIDTSVLGEFELTISYLTESVVWPYSVIEYADIDNISAPEFVSLYYFNIAEKSLADKRNEFMDRTEGYFVGDDNAFKFFPIINAVDEDGQDVNVTAYHSVSTIHEKNGSEWVKLSGAELDEVVAIDDFASTYDFTDEAIGNTYRLTVRPYGEKYAIAPKYSTSFEFTVADGFNVYTQDDLSHFDNFNNAYWDAYRAEEGITKASINGLFLHNDIEILRSNLPDGFFYMEGDEDIITGGLTPDADLDRVYGSLRDGVDLYHRDILPGESFVFNGNYFNIDYSTLPVVVRQDGDVTPVGEVISHATVIKAGEHQDSASDLGDYTMRNLSIVGNANRTEEGAKSGGAIFTKLLSVDSHLYNLIATQCFTIILTEYWGPNAIIEKTRGYDSFSSMLYNWGTANLLIKDSEFIGAGGPIIISDHVDPGTNGDEGYPANTKAENSVMKSLVVGTENWFGLVDAELAVTGINNLKPMFAAYGTNNIFVEDVDNIEKFDIIAVLKSGASKPSSDKIRGSFQIDNNTALDFESDFMASVASQIVDYPRFQSSDGQGAYFNKDYGALIMANGTPVTPYAATGTNYFNGDYMNTYYNIGSGEGFMGLVFGFYEPAA
ncbi:MAG: hypothetical protein EOM74_00640 [Methanomicrobia archaeon]|nr:hypothetical protein [Methanomicrobia archaeon]